MYLGHEPEHGFEDDQHRAVGYLSYISGSNEELEAYVEWIRQRAKGLVSKPINKAVIEELAEALLEHEELNQKAVRTIRADFIANMFPRRL